MAEFTGIDIGTSGAKALRVDGAGDVVASATAAYSMATPRPGWTEQDPEDWWAATQQVLAELGRVGDAIGLTGQMHGSVFLDAQGQVIRPALLWNDQRTDAECREIEAKVGVDRIREITGNPALTGFQLPKLLWLRNHEPEHFARVRHVLLPKDFIRFRLTGELATEPSDASGSGAFDLATRDWSDEILAALDLPRAWFPPVVESFAISAQTPEGLPVAGGAGDQAAGGVGTGAVVPGVVSVSLGTSGVVFTALEHPRVAPRGEVHTFCHANGGWHAMSVMLSCGGATTWFRETVGGGADFGLLESEAMTVPPGSEGVTFLPYLAGERSPHNDPAARGAFTGLTLGHGRGHLTRAMYEGVTFGLADGYAAIEALGVSATELRVSSGGAQSAFWVQMLADVLGRPCVRLARDEGPALGAALLAAVAIGAFPDVEQAAGVAVRFRDRFEPGPAAYAAARERFRAQFASVAHPAQNAG